MSMEISNSLTAQHAHMSSMEGAPQAGDTILRMSKDSSQASVIKFGPDGDPEIHDSHDQPSAMQAIHPDDGTDQSGGPTDQSTQAAKELVSGLLDLAKTVLSGAMSALPMLGGLGGMLGGVGKAG